jgi:ATP-dependent Clp protease ATP-binding subunit ClpC
MDASNILEPTLSRGEIKFIEATTLDESRKHIEEDSALERGIQPIQVNAPSVQDAIRISKSMKNCCEEHHSVRHIDEAIEEAVNFLPDILKMDSFR